MRIIIALLLLFSISANAQDTAINKSFLQNKNAISLLHKKQIAATAVHVSLITSSLIVLNKYWYSGYPHQKLGSFDDSKEWQQMDKMGHCFSAYLEANLSSALWKWTGTSKNKSVLYGGIGAFAYQASFEILDGLSAEYGFSWSDIAANTLGAGMLISQQYAWGEQRIIPKESYTHQLYDASLLARVNNLYGKKEPERYLKDYNGQTYWLSANLKSFFKQSNLPNWLNVAVGFGASGMYGGFENKWTDANGNIITRYDIPRKRQIYIAPDIDLTKIKTKSKVLKIVFFAMNLVKFPLPGIEFVNGKVIVKGIAF